MVNVEPNISYNGRYSIVETCRLLGISRNTLYRYTARNLIHYGIRTSTARKFYLGSEILRFWKQQM